MAIQNGCCYPIGCWGAHSFFERASQVGSVVVEFCEFVARTVETAWQAITLKGGVSSLVRAFECVFTGYMAGASTDPTSFVFSRLGAVLGVVVE